jgi:predicted nucleic acid-binding protein
MADLLVDTDIFVDHLRGAAPLKVGRNRVFYSIVTRCELLAGRAAQEELVRLLLSAFSELIIDRTVAESAGRIRRQADIALPDAIIAASAIEFDVPVVTRNRRDFERVRGLRVRAPS